MKNEKMLEMINNGQLEELKKLLQDELYSDSLKGIENKRYAAMKKYFKYGADQGNKALSMPCTGLTISGYGTVNAFCDSYTLVLTKESVREMETYDNSNNTYFKVESMFSQYGQKESIDLNKILSEAKSKGYKLKNSEIGNSGDTKYYMKYKNTYYKIGNIDKAFSIINDGSEADVIYNGKKSPLRINTSVGTCIVLPMGMVADSIEDVKIVIRVD